MIRLDDQNPETSKSRKFSMVQKAELRIGNLIKANASFTGYLFVTEITNDAVQTDKGGTLEFYQIQPVVLTPEILINAGFIFGRKFCAEDFYDVKRKKDVFGDEAWEFKRNNESLTDVLYFHQLQNLYYALSGEELSITI